MLLCCRAIAHAPLCFSLADGELLLFLGFGDPRYVVLRTPLSGGRVHDGPDFSFLSLGTKNFGMTNGVLCHGRGAPAGIIGPLIAVGLHTFGDYR